MTAIGIALCVGSVAMLLSGADDDNGMLLAAAIVFGLGYVGDQIKKLRGER